LPVFAGLDLGFASCSFEQSAFIGIKSLFKLTFLLRKVNPKSRAGLCQSNFSEGASVKKERFIMMEIRKNTKA